MDQTLARVFQSIFAMPPAEFNDSRSMENVKAWDSITHMTLILALEESFEVEFSPEEITRATNVGKIKELLAAHGAG